jgi:hypothetical protein
LRAAPFAVALLMSSAERSGTPRIWTRVMGSYGRAALRGSPRRRERSEALPLVPGATQWLRAKKARLRAAKRANWGRAQAWTRCGPTAWKRWGCQRCRLATYDDSAARRNSARDHTLMRHAGCLPSPIARLSRSVRLPTLLRLLVPTTGLAEALASSARGALLGAINIRTVARTADCE